MSWSIRYAGTKEESLKNIRSQAAGLPYKPGTLEGDDVVAAVARIEALAESLVPTERVVLSASGAHSTTSGGISSAGFAVSVSTAAS